MMKGEHDSADKGEGSARIARLAAALDPARLELIIMPTEKCNFRCTYCYENFSIGRMSPGMVNAIKLLLGKRAPSLRELRLSWFGGEPLVASDICMDIAAHAYHLAKANHISFHGAVTTNGWFLDLALVRKLVALEQRTFQVTLDGIEEVHDRTRIRANGKGTFARIWSNLEAMADSELDFSVLLRLHLMPHNLDGQEQLIRKLDAEFGSDRRFRILYHIVSDLGGPNVGKFPVLTDDEYSRRLAHLRKSSTLEWTSESQMMHDGAICYAARGNSLVIRANGRLAKCTVALADDRNDVGRVREDGTVELNSAKVQLWMSGFQDYDQKTLGCPLSTLDARSAVAFRDIPIRAGTR